MKNYDFRAYLEQVRAANDIVEVIGERIPLKGNTALCPFHREANPSFSISPAKQYFRCFSCRTAGDVFEFIKRFEQLEFMDALRLLAKRVGIQPMDPISNEAAAFRRDIIRADAIDAISRYYQDRLSSSAVTYLQDERGIPASLVQDRMLGYSDGSLPSVIVETLTDEQIEELVAVGILIENKNAETWAGQSPYRDRFRERVMFPVLERGRAVFLSGRTLTDRDDIPKYLHQRAMGTPLYNEDVLLTNPEQVMVVEGQIDTLSLIAWEYENTVGLLGGMKASSVKKLARISRVLLLLDADKAGLASTQGLVEALGPRRCAIVPLPMGQDPNDVYRSVPKSQFDRWIREAYDPIEFLVRQIPKSISLLELTDRLLPVLKILAPLPPPQVLYYEREVISPYFDWDKGEVMAFHTWLDQLIKIPPQRCPGCDTVLRRPRSS